MKSLIILAGAICLMQSCQFGEATDARTADTTIVYRDTTINPANAYSDLFLDSNAVENYIRMHTPDSNAARVLRQFYMVRNNGFAWFNSRGLTEEARSFWALYSQGDDSSATGRKDTNDSMLVARMDTLVQKDSMQISSNDTGYVTAELALTQRLIRYAEKKQGFISLTNIHHLVPRKKTDPLTWADSILHKHKDSALMASNAAWAAARQQLAIYYDAARKGGWQPLPSAAGMKKGTMSPAVAALKKRLQATGDYPAADTSRLFSDSLVAVVKDVQQRHGLAATGVVNDSLLMALNIPATERVQQLLLNMNRMLWMAPVQGANRIEVNIPAQMLYAYEGSNKVMEMPVIVGKEGTATVAFSGQINQVVFNPTWNLPESIVKNEIMPAMKKDPAYLKRNNMEVVGQQDSVPVIRQLPGKDNPLGKVKFLFPNTFDIYLHDTPDKSLFQRGNRALSHGCIRVADAGKLAEYLLRDQKEWTAEKIRAAMNGAKEEVVAVKSSQPVRISYLSAWVDPAGKLNFRNDINGRDKETMARLFSNSGSMDLAAGSGTDSTRADSAGRGVAVKPASKR